MRTSFALATLLVTTSLFAQATPPLPDACALLPATTINALFSTVVKQETETAPGVALCSHRSADNAAEVVVQYHKYANSEKAVNALRGNADSTKIEIANKTVVFTSYTGFEPFDIAGGNAHYLTGIDELKRPLVRLQFTIDKYLFMVNTKGIPHETLASKLAEIYTAIKQNAGL